MPGKCVACGNISLIMQPTRFPCRGLEVKLKDQGREQRVAVNAKLDYWLVARFLVDASN